jgi:hypothetical protein
MHGGLAAPPCSHRSAGPDRSAASNGSALSLPAAPCIHAALRAMHIHTRWRPWLPERPPAHAHARTLSHAACIPFHAPTIPRTQMHRQNVFAPPSLTPAPRLRARASLPPSWGRLPPCRGPSPAAGGGGGARARARARVGATNNAALCLREGSQRGFSDLTYDDAIVWCPTQRVVLGRGGGQVAACAPHRRECNVSHSAAARILQAVG